VEEDRKSSEENSQKVQPDVAREKICASLIILSVVSVDIDSFRNMVPI
jgi:hypothetical protein